MTTFSKEWEDKFGVRIYAENKESKELYECNPQKAIADVQSYYAVSKERAEASLIMSDIEHPISLHDCYMWVEVKAKNTDLFTNKDEATNDKEQEQKEYGNGANQTTQSSKAKRSRKN